MSSSVPGTEKHRLRGVIITFIIYTFNVVVLLEPAYNLLRLIFMLSVTSSFLKLAFLLICFLKT